MILKLKKLIIATGLAMAYGAPLIQPDFSPKVLRKEANSTMYNEEGSFLENVLYLYNGNLTIVQYYFNTFYELTLDEDRVTSFEYSFDCDITISYYSAQEGYQTPLADYNYSFSSDLYNLSDDLSINFPFDTYSISTRLLNVPPLEYDGGFILQLLPIIRINQTTINSQLVTYQVATSSINDFFNEWQASWNTILNGERINLGGTTNTYINLEFLETLKTNWEDTAFESGLTEGYYRGSADGYDEGYADGFTEGLNQNNFMNTIKQVFQTISEVMSVEILPNIRLWYIVGIPLILSVVRFILGWWR